MNIFEFIKAILKDSGASYNLNTGELNPSEGYMVANQGNEFVVPLEEFNIEPGNHILKYINKYFTELSNVNAYIGVWIDKGNVYIDTSYLFDNLDLAIKLGHDNNQKAIFDNENKVSIYLKK